MDQNIVITVGIPIFNAENNLKIAIKSVLNQSYSNFELILSDDGSTDRSLEIIKSFADERIRIVADGLNRGIGYRLNEQIKTSKGKYFARMDADDIMMPDRLKKQLHILESNENIDVLGGSAYLINNNNEILGIRESFSPNSLRDLIEHGGLFIHPTIMGRIEWFRKNNYDCTLSRVQDFELWIRTYENSMFVSHRDTVLFYRVDGLPCQKKYHKAFLNTKLILKKHKDKISAALYYKTLIKSFCKFIFFTVYPYNKNNISSVESNSTSFLEERQILQNLL